MERYKKLSHGEIPIQTYCLPKRTTNIKCYLPIKAVNNKATTEYNKPYTQEMAQSRIEFHTT